ncbi:hypothetical protein PIROE2DRAFT_4298 [Piromyces sp. E2]|nr:hypothetical protein PIROE2DRAFT_4298 [Piromyces sp. E2]|eukprot:OUM68148.1 hypothetical protein PIROE2DRAFT_4298 [Piromyces sp. E2]
MKQFKAILLLLGLVSMACGKAINENETEGKYNRENINVNREDANINVSREDVDVNVNREDVVIDNIKNLNETSIEPESIVSLTYMYEGERNYTPEGVLCYEEVLKGNKVCTFAANKLGPYNYGDNRSCYLTEMRAGPNDYIKLEKGYRDYTFHIDINGYLTCEIKGKTYKRYRKFNLKGGIGPVTHEVYHEHFDKWAYDYGKKIYAGKTHYEVGRMDLYLTIDRCTDVFTFKNYHVSHNCETGK